MPIARPLSVGLAVVMMLQAITGRLFHQQYRDPELLKTTWIGNDWVTLIVAAPLLLVGTFAAVRGSRRATLLWLGVLGYAVYNYAFYLFGASLNAFFPLYVVAFVIATLTLMMTLASIDRAVVAFTAAGHALRLAAVTQGVVGMGLACVWLGMWAGYVFAGRPTPIDPEAFKLVAALDLSLMVPALIGGSVLLWRRAPWGVVVAALASIQGALYLLVLFVNSLIAIGRGLGRAPGELLVWGPLLLLTTTAALIVVGSVESRARAERV